MLAESQSFFLFQKDETIKDAQIYDVFPPIFFEPRVFGADSLLAGEECPRQGHAAVRECETKCDPKLMKFLTDLGLHFLNMTYPFFEREGLVHPTRMAHILPRRIWSTMR